MGKLEDLHSIWGKKEILTQDDYIVIEVIMIILSFALNLKLNV